MLRKWLLMSCLILSASWVSAESDYEKMSLVVPKGDPQAGREAFLALGCTSCHFVEGQTGEGGLPGPKVTMPVPTLGSTQAKVAPGKLASAIVAPSHKVSEEVQMRSEGELSPMGDFSDSLTVRQLVDLVAYVRSLGSREKSGEATYQP